MLPVGDYSVESAFQCLAVISNDERGVWNELLRMLAKPEAKLDAPDAESNERAGKARHLRSQGVQTVKVVGQLRPC